jgi:hypothetical protein
LGSSLGIFDLRNFQTYLLSIFDRNSKKILLGPAQTKTQQDLLASLNDYRSQLDAVVSFFATVTLILVLFLLFRMLDFRLLILVPTALFSLVFIQTINLRRISLASFKILASSDNDTKAKLGLVYKASPKEPRKTFLQEVKLWVEASGYSGVIEHGNRDIRQKDLFK